MRVWLRTWGCRANAYDTQQVEARLRRAGLSVASSPNEADVAVLNSCAVTAEAVADLRQGARRAARENPGLRTIVMGCAAALDDGSISALPTVTDVIAGGDVDAVAAALGLPPDARPAEAQSDARATLRVQDGCDEHCTFCATTQARGANRSRTAEALVAEARMLAVTHPEIVLTGVHVGTYGADLGTSLGALLTRLVEEVPTTRFRLASVEATEVCDPLRMLLRDGGDRVAPYLHAPLQSGSDAVLRRMGRHWYTADRYRQAVERLVDGRAVFGLGADIITGFPGETDADHRATMSLVEALPFTHLHVFPWSPRPGTAATKLGAAVAPAVARARAAELRALGRAKADAYARRRVGGRATAVVVQGGPAPEGVTEDYLSVLLPAGATRRTVVRGRLAATGRGRLQLVPDP
ncbi:MAG: MiaB/RimO family radical SAM methylthiotransferase [Gemmatimonadaceae bacterium]|nr:MiaB/RimO family radical SAM methylthiotransferase [Gemmatimonadaceae bacterium]